MLAEAWPRVTQGLPLPSTVTRISPSSIFSSPGINLSAYFRRGVPTTGVMVIAFDPPANTGTGRDMDFGSIDLKALPSVFCMNNHLLINTVSGSIGKKHESLTDWAWHQVHILSS
jgi:hypothetical protein